MEGVLDATEFGPHCPQVATPYGSPSTSEDCLFLNVFTPDKTNTGAAHLLPVMFWIHGGGLVVGASDGYDPAKLVAQGVVVVTINYRLGELGFLAHPALAAESPTGASGNYGLLDQQAAMRWVQRNIRAFGGDPDNVTIFGESAGGLSVHSQLASPLAAGLFHKAIVESGAYSLNQPPLATRRLPARRSRPGRLPDQTAACLRSLPVRRSSPPSPQATMVPNLDGFVLPQTVRAAFTTGQFNHVPVIEGSNHDEWRLFVAQTEATTGVPLTAAGYIPAIAATLGVPLSVATAIAAAAYPLAAYPSPSVALGAVGTDAIFSCNARSRRVCCRSSSDVPVRVQRPSAPMLFFPSGELPDRRLPRLRAPVPLQPDRHAGPEPWTLPRSRSSPTPWSGTGRGSHAAVIRTRPASRLAAVRDERPVPVAATVGPDDGDRLRRRPQLRLLGFELRADLG